jgi:GNAT superfamily N-acetyltransferase
MLRVEPAHDKEILNALYLEIFGAPYPKDIGFLLYEQGRAAGIANIDVRAAVSEIIAVGVLPAERKKGFGDFLTRVILDRLTTVSEKVRVRYVSDYFLPFGFKIKDDGMEIKSKDIRFPKKCEEK